ncbi:MAG: hypothetical protein Q9216_005660 [Gyalolechia sp. 2 TL-2023]
MFSSTSRIRELANRIRANVDQLDTYLDTNNLPQPSFAADGPVELCIKSTSVEACRLATIEDAIEIQDLLLGPKMLLRPMYNATSLQAIYKYDIANKVPQEGEVSYPELAQRCGIYEPDLKRILRFAMCYHRAFREPRKGFIAHNTTSLVILENPGVRDALGVMFDESYQSYARGWALAHDTNLPFYKYLALNSSKSARFAGAMQAFEDGPDISPSYLVENYAWSSYGSGLVVDVGGSLGSICIAIAEAHPTLRFVVQDRPDIVKIGSLTLENLPTRIAERIDFMAHDFFEEQTIQADIYLFRYIFHNWPDAYVIKILRQLIPSLKSGAKIVINETLLPEPNTSSLTREREVR